MLDSPCQSVAKKEEFRKGRMGRHTKSHHVDWRLPMKWMNKIEVPFYEIFFGGKNCFSMTVIEPTNMTEELNQRERSEQTFKIEIVFILRESLESFQCVCSNCFAVVCIPKKNRGTLIRKKRASYCTFWVALLRERGGDRRQAAGQPILGFLRPGRTIGGQSVGPKAASYSCQHASAPGTYPLLLEQYWKILRLAALQKFNI